MRIGFLTSHRGHKQFEKEHKAIVEHFKKRGHDVVHSLDTSLEKLMPLSYSEREAIFLRFYQELEECDLIFAECSLQSTQVGYGLAQLRAKGKPIVIISIKGVAGELSPKGDTYSNVDNAMVSEYTLETLSEILDDALDSMAARIDKRFTIIFPAHLLAKLEVLARKKKLPKAVYIRQLVENEVEKAAVE